MSVMLQVRHLPDEVHAKLKQRAATARMSLSDYVAAQLAELVSYRSNAEILDDLHARIGNHGLTRDDITTAVSEARDEMESR